MVDAKTGKLQWAWWLGDPLMSAPTIAGGRVFSVSRAPGTRGWQAPSAGDGWIYVGTGDGHLVALDTGDRSLTGWPMWGGGAGRNG